MLVPRRGIARIQLLRLADLSLNGSHISGTQTSHHSVSSGGLDPLVPGLCQAGRPGDFLTYLQMKQMLSINMYTRCSSYKEAANMLSHIFSRRARLPGVLFCDESKVLADSLFQERQMPMPQVHSQGRLVSQL